MKAAIRPVLAIIVLTVIVQGMDSPGSEIQIECFSEQWTKAFCKVQVPESCGNLQLILHNIK